MLNTLLVADMLSLHTLSLQLQPGGTCTTTPTAVQPLAPSALTRTPDADGHQQTPTPATIVSTDPEQTRADAVRGDVLGITEMMEMILLKLPLRDLFRIQRTCKYFKATIEESIKLQRAMYLVPVECKPNTTWEDCVINPILKEYIYHPIKYPEDRFLYFREDDRNRPLDFPPRTDRDGFLCDFSHSVRLEGLYRRIIEKARKPLRNFGKDGTVQSWRRTLLSQPLPPAGKRNWIREIVSMEHQEIGGGQRCKYSTLGDCFDHLESLYEHGELQDLDRRFLREKDQIRRQITD